MPFSVENKETVSTPCLSLWERCLSEAKTERVHKAARPSHTELQLKSLKKILRQHRTIRQEVSGRIFVPIQSSENGGILYVFPIFGTAEVEQKDG